MIWASNVSLQSWCRETWISCKKGFALMSQKTCFPRWTPTHRSSNGWLLVTRRGFMSITRTPDIKRMNGVHSMSRDRKNHSVFSRKRRWCSQFSWITEMLCIINSFPKARPSTRSIIWALWDVCVKPFAKKDRICGQTTRGFCTTITHRRTMPSLSVIGSSAGISTLQSMGSTLKWTISIMLNKLVFLILKIKS